MFLVLPSPHKRSDSTYATWSTHTSSNIFCQMDLSHFCKNCDAVGGCKWLL